MDIGHDDLAGGETSPITVRYWASARAASGVETDALPVTGPITLADVVRRASALRPGTRLPAGRERRRRVAGDQRENPRHPEALLLRPGQAVEFLPPFAGG